MRIRRWLSDAGSGLHVVTGGAAASELLSRVLDEVREVPDQPTFPIADGVGVALGLAGMSVRDCVRRLAGALTPTRPAHRMADLADALADRDSGTVTVIMDGLEAARDPLGVAGTVARRLAAEPGARVLVGTRPRTTGNADLVAALGPATILHLPATDDDAVVRSWRELLRGLADRAPHAPALLHALGYALGGGMPVRGEVWPAMAAAIHHDGTRPTEAETAQVLRLAEELVIADAPGLIRLRHHDLAAECGQGAAPASRAAGHRRIAAALRDLAARRGWPDADRYIQTRLAAHAAAGDAMDELLADNDALDHLHPDHLADEVTRHYAGRADRPATAAGLLMSQEALAEAAPAERRMLRVLGARKANATPADTPGSETTWWPRWANHRTIGSLTRLTGHRASINAMVALPVPDGRVIMASGCDDGVIRLWDPLAAEQIGAPLTGHPGGVHALAGLPLKDGRTVLASWGRDGLVRLWDPVTGKSAGVSAHGHHARRDGTAAVSAMTAMPWPDGRHMIASAGTEDGTIRLWDPATGADLGGVIVDGAGIASAMTTVRLPGERTLIAAGFGRQVCLWDPFLAAGHPVGHNHPVWTMTAATLAGKPLHGPTGQSMLASTDMYSARLWDADTGTPIQHFVPPGVHIVMGTIPLRNGQVIVNDDRTRLWDPLTGKQVAGRSRSSFTVPVQHPDGAVLVASATSGHSPQVELRNLATGDRTAVLIWPEGRIRAVRTVPRPDGHVWLACRTDDDTVRFWDVTTGEPVGRPLPDEVREHRLLTAVTLPGGLSAVVTGADDGTVRCWDPATGTAVGPTLAGHHGPVRAAVAVRGTSDRVWLATGADDGLVRVWTIDGTCVMLIRLGSPVHAMSTAPDGGVAVGTDLGLVVLDMWPERAHTAVQEAATAVPETRVAVPKAQMTAASPGAVRLDWRVAWQVGGGKRSLPATTVLDGRETLVALASDHMIGIWDTAHGTPAGQPYTGHAGDVTGLTATVLDGRPAVISFGEETAPTESEHDHRRLIRVWDPVTHEPVGTPIDDGGFTENGLHAGGLAVVPGGGEPLLVGIEGNEWGSQAVAWSLRTRREHRRFTLEMDFDMYTDALLPVMIDGTPAIVTVTNDDEDEGDEEDVLLVSVWDVHTGDLIGQSWRVPYDGRSTVVTAGLVSGVPVMALYAPDDRIRLRRLPDNAPIGSLPVADVGKPKVICIGNLGDVPILAAGHNDGVVTLWDLTQRHRCATIDGLGTINDLLVTATGLIIVATDDGLTAIRASLAPAGAPPEETRAP
ncbi:WD40 repeat domain-containing protein [Nonomuraea sp. B10E15]|uniref:WD40 repeat domain-containing protein n=1 Tax=Nonomuraea sp. B10E15 TaxID=3153560 RepID=UPI00325D2BAB